jgi:hypothetical protein
MMPLFVGYYFLVKEIQALPQILQEESSTSYLSHDNKFSGF